MNEANEDYDTVRSFRILDRHLIEANIYTVDLLIRVAGKEHCTGMNCSKLYHERLKTIQSLVFVYSVW